MSDAAPIVSGYINPARAAMLGLTSGPIPPSASSSAPVPTSRQRSRSPPRRTSRSPRKEKKSRRSRSRSPRGKKGRSRTRSRSRGKKEEKSSSRRDRSVSRSKSRDRRKTRKARNWDQPPPGADQMGSSSLQQQQTSHSTGFQSTNLSGVSSHGPSSPWTTTNLNAQNLQLLQAQALQAQILQGLGIGGGGGGNQAQSQLNKKARTVYVGNVQPQINANDLTEFFNREIIKVSGRPPTAHPPVESVQINHEKAYAFVEMYNYTDADIAMAFDGTVIKQQPLRCRRPKDYAPVPGHSVKSWSVGGVISTQVEDGPYKIFIGGLPTAIGDDDLKTIVSAFGELHAFTLVKDTGTGMSKGYAFFMYKDTNVTNIAVQGLNGMQLGDKMIVCKIANSALAQQVPQQQAQNFLSMMAMGSLSGLLPTPTASAALSAGLIAQPASPVIMMRNMVTANEIADENEYGDILADVRDECGKYGQVVTVLIPRPVDFANGGCAPDDVGQVFVEFTGVEAAQIAHNAISGRRFSGRTIVCTFLPMSDWQLKKTQLLASGAN